MSKYSTLIIVLLIGLAVALLVIFPGGGVNDETNLHQRQQLLRGDDSVILQIELYQPGEYIIRIAVDGDLSEMNILVRDQYTYIRHIDPAIKKTIVMIVKNGEAIGSSVYYLKDEAER